MLWHGHFLDKIHNEESKTFIAQWNVIVHSSRLRDKWWVHKFSLRLQNCYSRLHALQNMKWNTVQLHTEILFTTDKTEYDKK